MSIGVGAFIVVDSYMGDRKDIARMELEKARVEKGYILQERDLNNNGLPERFYEIDGKTVFCPLMGIIWKIT